MRIAMAYIGVILIWSTTPLAMKWSTESVGFLFALTSRMGIGAAIAVLICCLLKLQQPFDRKALMTYAASGISTYMTMMCGYWGVQYIPSGWISVIFGLAPIFTSIIGSRCLGENNFTIIKTAALSLCLAGLFVMFRQGLVVGDETVYGISAIVLGAVFYSLGIVAFKHINAGVPPIASMTGTLIVALALFLVTWNIGEFRLPESVPTRSAGAIVYLGIVGSVLGFLLFYYVLQKIEATRASLITLITPGNALLLGCLLNDEPFNRDIVLGAIMVIGGLILFQFETIRMVLRMNLFNRTLPGKLDTMYTSSEVMQACKQQQ
jgi:drug/metabolite transporter (DMT)-like permease